MRPIVEFAVGQRASLEDEGRRRRGRSRRRGEQRRAACRAATAGAHGPARVPRTRQVEEVDVPDRRDRGPRSPLAGSGRTGPRTLDGGRGRTGPSANCDAARRCRASPIRRGRTRSVKTQARWSRWTGPTVRRVRPVSCGSPAVRRTRASPGTAAAATDRIRPPRAVLDDPLEGQRRSARTRPGPHRGPGAGGRRTTMPGSTCVRRTTVLTEARRRPGRRVGRLAADDRVPMTTSSVSPSRPSRTASAACSAVKTLEPDSSARSATRRWRSASIGESDDASPVPTARSGGADRSGSRRRLRQADQLPRPERAVLVGPAPAEAPRAEACASRGCQRSGARGSAVTNSSTSSTNRRWWARSSSVAVPVRVAAEVDEGPLVAPL